MQQIQWAERYRTGIPFIDAQHQEIFRAVARLQEALGGPAEPDSIQALLQDLLLQLHTHFRDEEAFLDRFAYPELLPHAAEHASLTGELEELLARFQGVPASGAAMVSTFLAGWLRHHISGEDFRYAEYMRGGEGQGPAAS